MIRFLCTVCEKVKRVRQLPSSVRPIVSDLTGKITGYSSGQCRWHEQHGDGASRAQINHRGRIRAGIGSTRKLSASAAKSKSKKG